MSACVGINRFDQSHGRERRAAMLKKRFAETISKAAQQLQNSDTTAATRQPEKKKRPRIIEAEILVRKDLMLKRRRGREREAIRKMEKSVQIYDDNAAILKGLEEMCSGSTAYDLFYGDFCGNRARRPLEKLGLFLKKDEDGKDDQDGVAVVDLEEGEIRIN